MSLRLAPIRPRRLALLALAGAMAAPVTLAGCIISSTPPNPHKQGASDTPDPDGDPPDAGDAGADANPSGEP